VRTLWGGDLRENHLPVSFTEHGTDPGCCDEGCHRHVLRQRSDGQTCKSTITLANEMGISDVTVRLMEH
jgi:hypothetical protein